VYLLHHLLERAASSWPQKEAVVDRDRRFDWAGVRRAAGALAAALEEHGIERRDRVAIYLDKCFEEAASIFGISMAGGVFVPVNALLKPTQVGHIVSDCQVRFLVTTDARWRQLQSAIADLASIEKVFLVDRPEMDDPRLVREVFSRAPIEKPNDACIGEDLAAILYTSGSTGRPKGVMLSHRNLIAGSRIVCTYVGIQHDERILSVLPFSFDYGLNQLVTATDKGATIVLLSFRFGDEIVRTIQKEKITGLAGVPTVWAMLTQAAPSFAKTKLETLRYITNSGGPVPSETSRKIRELQPHVSIFLMYGLTEAFRSTYLPPSEVDRRPTSIGKAIPETEIFLVNSAGERCKAGESGILVHRGPTVSLGYWNRPEDTARVLKKNPLLGEHEGSDVVCVSGDLVRMDEEGFLYFVGRNDAMIKSAGYRISPSEVEEVLMATKLLAQAAVIGLPDAIMGERVHAVVVPAANTQVDKASLLDACTRELPQHMVPRDIEVVSELPRSPNGKVDHKRLRADRLEHSK
jgi:acyl-CoA ligase (AMP-forming) (exosortase A-associated)